MAVFTPVSNELTHFFLDSYDLGELVRLEPIAQGVENSNFHLYTTRGHYILTLFEGRTDCAALPFYFDFMDHVRGGGVPCPEVIRARAGDRVRRVAGKPAAILSFLTGQGVQISQITPDLCGQMGNLCARLHRLGADFPQGRVNTVSYSAWVESAARCRDAAKTVYPGLSDLIERELRALGVLWSDLAALPRGAVHADLFPDNVFIDESARVCGVIDFYFSCTEAFVYDLAIVLNAWCFTPDYRIDELRLKVFLDAYQAVRPLSEGEKKFFQIVARGAALRFLVSRLYDATHRPADALVYPKDPLEYQAKLEFHQRNCIF